MNESASFKRHPTTQDISWLLDAKTTNHLELDPPYQRKSVWTRKDRQFFLDTIFRGYPSPAIFLEKEITNQGISIYNVVDGKQRLETIFMFVNNKIKIASNFGDSRLDGKKWKQLGIDEKKMFWNYQIPVEMVDFPENQVVNEIFDRLNRNSRKLKRQELRHAKFDGWFIRFVETEIEDPFWKRTNLSRGNRDKRMQDVQILSELFFIILERNITGFDQDKLDYLYAKYDDFDDDFDDDEEIDYEMEKMSEDEFRKSLDFCKKYLSEFVEGNDRVPENLKTNSNLYTLWAVISLHSSELPSPKIASDRYVEFMTKVRKIASSTGKDEFEIKDNGMKDELAFRYWTNSRGASTDLKQRQERYDVLNSIICK